MSRGRSAFVPLRNEIEVFRRAFGGALTVTVALGGVGKH
jgi:hypothetical protein